LAFVAVVFALNPTREDMGIRKVIVEKNLTVREIRPPFWIAQPFDPNLAEGPEQITQHLEPQTVARFRSSEIGNWTNPERTNFE
jgi:hypothetical protein